MVRRKKVPQNTAAAKTGRKTLGSGSKFYQQPEVLRKTGLNFQKHERKVTAVVQEVLHDAALTI